MRQYEVMYILDPGLEEEQQTALVERFHTLVGAQGGEVQHVDRWERRRLAYEINGRREGYYVVMNFRSEPAAEAELTRVLGLTEGVLRHLITRMDERRAQKAITEARTAAEAKARAQAEARAAAEAQAASTAAEAAQLEASAALSPAADGAATQADGQQETTGTVEETTGTEVTRDDEQGDPDRTRGE